MIENCHIYKKLSKVFFLNVNPIPRKNLQSIIDHHWSMIENGHIYTKKNSHK